MHREMVLQLNFPNISFIAQITLKRTRLFNVRYFSDTDVLCQLLGGHEPPETLGTTENLRFVYRLSMNEFEMVNQSSKCGKLLFTVPAGAFIDLSYFLGRWSLTNSVSFLLVYR